VPREHTCRSTVASWQLKSRHFAANEFFSLGSAAFSAGRSVLAALAGLLAGIAGSPAVFAGSPAVVVGSAAVVVGSAAVVAGGMAVVAGGLGAPAGGVGVAAGGVGAVAGGVGVVAGGVAAVAGGVAVVAGSRGLGAGIRDGIRGCRGNATMRNHSMGSSRVDLDRFRFVTRHFGDLPFGPRYRVPINRGGGALLLSGGRFSSPRSGASDSTPCGLHWRPRGRKM
jgi:hypothetical protein